MAKTSVPEGDGEMSSLGLFSGIRPSFQGRLRNLHLPFSEALHPLFEAVINSIQAISDAKLSPGSGLILIRILRQQVPKQQAMECGKRAPGAPKSDPIIGFEVVDNGVGFTNDNVTSFLTLDSLYKFEQGGKGVGRLLWLKAFSDVVVDSTYRDAAGKLKRRRFTFSKKSNGVGDLEDADGTGEPETSISLNGFAEHYSNAAPKGARVIGNKLLEHCLWYFVRPNGPPRIRITDGDESVDMADVYEGYIKDQTDEGAFEIKGVKFDVSHIRMKSATPRENFLALCATDRVVTKEKLESRIPGLGSALKDEDGSEFLYACYVTSDYLDDTVQTERLGFNIPQTSDELSSTVIPSMAEIKTKIVEVATEYLSPYLQDLRTQGRKRVTDYVQKHAGRYKPLLKGLPEDFFLLDPKVTEKEIESKLHDKLWELEQSLLADGKALMAPVADESVISYKARLESYKKKLTTFKQSDLANYVFHRKSVIEILASALTRNSDGHYAREDVIHELVMPMGTVLGEVGDDGNNLWLIDERLAFYEYVASDKQIRSMAISGSGDAKEPDIAALNVMDEVLLVSDNTMPQATLTIVEFKRPMRKDLKKPEKDPISQALDYLKRIRDGNVTTAQGRPIPNAQNIPGFCYIICDLNNEMIECCERNQLERSSDGLSYFTYHRNFKAYIEVTSFDQMVKAAKQRNHAFFKKLGLPTD